MATKKTEDTFYAMVKYVPERDDDGMYDGLPWIEEALEQHIYTNLSDCMEMLVDDDTYDYIAEIKLIRRRKVTAEKV